MAQFLAVANFLCAVAHYDYVCDATMTKLLELPSERMAAEVISKKKTQGHCLSSAEDGQSAVGIGADLQTKIKSLLLQFMGAGPYGGSYTPLLLNLI